MREMYGIILTLAMLLMTGCSADDVVMETMTAPEGGVAISFSCNYDDEGVYITKAGHEGAMNTEDLHTTGFGAMASVTAGNDPEDNKPDLMYNQEVAFTLVGDLINPKKGYWSYEPKKYWPSDLTNCYISAYAPYVDPSDLEGLSDTETGIYGISANNEAPYIDYRRCEKPSEVVDLLWYYEKPSAIPVGTALNKAGTLAMQMHHALARLEIKVALAADPGTTKVLVEEITLKGKMAKTGRLHLYEQTTTTEEVEEVEVTKYYPIWSDQTFDLDHTIIIDNDETNEASYGIIDTPIRYIPGLPREWQPEGLKYCDNGGEGKGFQNALNTGDRKGYIYLIPQNEELNLKITVKYQKWESGVAEPTERTKTTEAAVTTIADPLKGNKTYTLNLTLSGI